jgi:transcriptional regulator of acetoin/glycerol metabolism
MGATTRDLAVDVRAGRYPAELHQRWNGLTFKLPTLGERGSHVVQLAASLLKLVDPRLSLDDDAAEVLVGYAWPGNVRELKVVLQRAAMLAPRERISADTLRAALGTGSPAPALSPADLERHFLATIRPRDDGSADADEPESPPDTKCDSG